DGEPEVDKNFRHDGGVREKRQHPPASATLAAPKNVDGEDASQECRPVEKAGKDCGRDTGGSGEGSGRFVVGARGRGRHDLGSTGSIGGEDAVEPGEVPPWGRDLRRQTTEELEGREDELGSTAPPGTLQAVCDHSSGGEGETREGERRSAGVAREPLEPEAGVGRGGRAGGGRESLEGGAPAPGRLGHVLAHRRQGGP